jgi:hypothetical protein
MKTKDAKQCAGNLLSTEKAKSTQEGQFVIAPWGLWGCGEPLFQFTMKVRRRDSAEWILIGQLYL